MPLHDYRSIAFIVGAMLFSHSACAASIPAEAIAAAEACEVSWRGEVPQIAEFTRPSEQVLCVRGEFQLGSLASVRAVTNPAAVRELVITSGGGLTESAIELAKFAEAHGWLIVIKDRCFSSCANYVFLSRTKKVVLPQSVVGWHGLPSDPSAFDPDAFEQQKLQMIEKLHMPAEWKSVDAKTMLSFLVHSKEFLAERNIPPELCRSVPQVGHAKDYVARLNTLSQGGANPFWSYGRMALEKKFNVQGILYMWEPETPEEGTRLAMQRFNADVFFFDLSSNEAGRDPDKMSAPGP